MLKVIASPSVVFGPNVLHAATFVCHTAAQSFYPTVIIRRFTFCLSANVRCLAIKSAVRLHSFCGNELGQYVDPIFV